MKSIYIYRISLLVIVIFMSSCIKNKQTTELLIGDSQGIRISAKDNVLKTAKYDTFLTNLKFVKLETAHNCLIGGEIRNVKIDNDLIFILDNNTNLFIFESNGKFLRKIGQRGNGPGEIMRISNFFLNKELKEIGLFDISKNTILIFDYEGNFIKNIKFNQRLNVKEIEFISNDELLVEFLNTKHNDASDSENRYNYGIVNLANKSIKERFIPFLVRLNIPVVNRKLMRVANEQAFMTTLFSSTLYKYDSNLNKLEKLFELIPNNDLKTISSSTFDDKQSEDFMDIVQYTYKNNYSQGINQIILTSNYLYLNYWAEKGKLQNIVFNLETQKNFEFNLDNKLLTELDNDIFDFSTFNSNSTVIKILQSGYLISNKEKYKPIKGLYKSIEELNEEDNPILLLYGLNNLFEATENEN